MPNYSGVSKKDGSHIISMDILVMVAGFFRRQVFAHFSDKSRDRDREIKGRDRDRDRGRGRDKGRDKDRDKG
jgi:hypothetical protein